LLNINIGTYKTKLRLLIIYIKLFMNIKEKNVVWKVFLNLRIIQVPFCEMQMYLNRINTCSCIRAFTVIILNNLPFYSRGFKDNDRYPLWLLFLYLIHEIACNQEIKMVLNVIVELSWRLLSSDAMVKYMWICSWHEVLKQNNASWLFNCQTIDYPVCRTMCCLDILAI
jgi:hypothetical protein